MNRFRTKYRKGACFAVAVLLSHAQIRAQQMSLGNMNVFGDAKITFFGPHRLSSENAGPQQPGVIGTTRRVPFSIVNFIQPLDAQSFAAGAGYIDGYARKYEPGTFVFPVGDKGVAAPFMLETAPGEHGELTFSVGAYFYADPAVALTDNIAGQDETTALPAGAPFIEEPARAAEHQVSKVEYWDVDSNFPAKLTLGWRQSSDLSAVVGRDLSKLCIVGWNADKKSWVEIPAEIDGVSKLTGESSTISSGSITTKEYIPTGAYVAYTFASKSSSLSPILNAKVFLQGPASGRGLPRKVMANSLQSPDPELGITNLLPISDPYDRSSIYPQIADPAGPAGKIVDWVRVDIVATDLNTVLETRNLLLQTNGDIVDVLGGKPEFSSQEVPVHLVIRHRNHLPVVSALITSFSSGTIDYDFTDALSKALAEPGAPPQMVLQNGAWAMLAGNSNFGSGRQPLPVDNVIYLVEDGQDVSTIYRASVRGDFGKYQPEDTNFDGAVDGKDYSTGFFNAAFPYYSILINHL